MKVLNSYEKRQGGYDVNDVINKLSDIEQASVNIMDKTASFDAQIQADTAKKLAELRTQMEVDMQAKLSKQKSDAEETLRQMEDSYAAHHTEYAQALFRTMTER